ncbi:hypothetical protein B9Z55_026855 [Caenorhabditis nigoni]|uniref:Purple acid phosphatase n=1 Tax=Caenorhabditis nigoni TaxID=1611254 RepID=A0A2G5SI89_9PELO|nr:hypothetical protein B9Z55_026855 [Caenorhabditis nigoni]
MTIFLYFLIYFLLPQISRTHQYLPIDRIPDWKLKNDGNIGPSYGQPEQIRISYGGDPSISFVTWQTFDDTLQSIVEYGSDWKSLNQSILGRCSVFLDRNKNSVWRYIHRANLTGLVPGQTYYYHVGSEHGWSPIYFFTALKERENDGGGYIYAVYGDLGVENGRSLGTIQKMAQRGELDLVLHVGDFAYNMDESNGETGDEFLRQIEPISAYIPYMAAVGNHEYFNNFTHFVNRFTMPNSDHNLFYSYDLGPAHFVVFSTEFYFNLQWGYHQMKNQFEWLKEDLKKANENRKSVPWIITMGHRPMYCSDFDGDDCTKYESIIRTGLPLTHGYGLEKLFYEYGVDIELWAHEHSYERLWPVYNRTVYNGTHLPYTNPPTPVHIITGSAGCRENTDVFVEHPPPWSAVRSTDYGFGIMRIYNSTHLNFKQINVAQGGTEDDDFWVVKTSDKHHRPFKHRDLKKLRTYGTHVPEKYCHHHSHCPVERKKKRSRRQYNHF